jgi:hypothetical protein
VIQDKTKVRLSPMTRPKTGDPFHRKGLLQCQIKTKNGSLKHRSGRPKNDAEEEEQQGRGGRATG